MTVIRGMGLYLGGNVVESGGDIALADEILPGNAEGLRRRLTELYRRASEHPSEFVWIGLFEPSKAELSLVQDVFGLASLQVEDAANHRQRPKVELGDDGLRFFSIDPGHVTTERQKAAQRAEQFSRHNTGATPEVIGAAVAWLATDPEGQAELDGQIVYAQRECKRRQLLPGWPPPRD